LHLFYNSEAEAEAQPEGCRVIFSTGCGCTWGNRSIHWRRVAPRVRAGGLQRAPRGGCVFGEIDCKHGHSGIFS